MAVLPHIHIEAALASSLHLQLVVRSVHLPAVTPGDAIVTGEVVRVFRGRAADVGTLVDVAIGVLREGDLPPASGRYWLSVPVLEAAKVIEVYADVGADGVLFLAGEQYHLLDVATDTPALVYGPDDALPPAWMRDHDPGAAHRRADLIFALSMVAFAVVGVFCVVSAFSVLLR